MAVYIIEHKMNKRFLTNLISFVISEDYSTFLIIFPVIFFRNLLTSKLLEAEISTTVGGPCRVRTSLPVRIYLDDQVVEGQNLDENLILFNTEERKKYQVKQGF